MVREATLDDVPQLVEMGVRFVTETSYISHMRVCRERIESSAARLVTGPDSVVYVHERNGKLNGMIGMMSLPHLWDGDLLAAEMAWWVEPEARTGLAGVRLLRAAERWAFFIGATRLVLVAPNDRVEAFYVRAGYEKVETSYQKVLRRAA
jgi:GNAT superfamily N-acetyltransferase